MTNNAQYVWKKLDRPQTCVLCGFQHIEISHIKDVKAFPMNALVSDINSPQNLIGLCPNHHWLLDRGLLSEEDIIGNF
jgi:predicted restriction endonuclease